MGIWTPNARVICHGNTFQRGLNETLVLTEAAKENESNLICSENRVTFCDDCRMVIQVDESVGAEHNLVLSLQSIGIEAAMQQTSRMNSACGVNTTSEG